MLIISLSRVYFNLSVGWIIRNFFCFLIILILVFGGVFEDVIQCRIFFVAEPFEVFVWEVAENWYHCIINKADQNNGKVEFTWALEFRNLTSVLEKGEKGQEKIEKEVNTDDYIDEKNLITELSLSHEEDKGEEETKNAMP